MRILTWNVNGIRASKRCLKDILDSLNADVVCLQETKITRDMLDEPTAIVDGYNAYYCFARNKKGYSGTAIYCKDSCTPCAAEEGLAGLLTSQVTGSIGCLPNVTGFSSEELHALEMEGRAVITQHKIQLGTDDVRELAIINVYVPRAAGHDERWTYKQHFLALLQSRAENLLRNGKHVIVLGDINTTHKRIDHCDNSSFEFLKTDSRKWIDQFLRPEDRDPELDPIEDRSTFPGLLPGSEGGLFLDTYRFFHPDKTEAYTMWDTVTAARQTNYGKRLDYIFIDTGLQEYLASCKIVADFEGSDHCPVVLEINCKPVPAPKCPPLCTKLMPEFQGKQQKLLSFFSRKVPSQKEAADRTVKNSAKVEDEASDRDKVEKVNMQEVKVEDLPSSQSSTDSTVLASSTDSTVLASSTDSTMFASSSDVETHGSESQLRQTTGSLKRPLSGKTAMAQSGAQKKKKGVGTSSSPAGSRQPSLLNFFRKPTQHSEPALDSSDAAVHLMLENPGKPSFSPSSQAKGDAGKLSAANLLSEKSAKILPSKLSSPSKPKLSLPSVSHAPSKSKSADETSRFKDFISQPVVKKAKEKTSPTLGGDDAVLEAASETKPTASTLWKGLLSGLPPAPLCKGHQEPCVLRTVKKGGTNKGKQFYTCARPEGHSTNKEARCDYFQWITTATSKKAKK